MGRLGGQGKGKPKLKDRNIGKALIKQMKAAKEVSREANKLNSILDNSPLEDYIISAEMDENDCEVVRVHDQDAYLVEPTVRVFQKMNLEQFDYEHLQIPRKPSWNKEMSAEEIDRREKNAFLDWRRNLAAIETSEANESRRVTPYEKNLDVWRQLWRVLERSDIAVQIVDARNPLMFYTQDLLKYATELKPPRPMMLLVNKADFLSTYQRSLWASYFHSKGIAFAFYSAHDEQKRIDSLDENALTVDDGSDEYVSRLAGDIVEQWHSFRLKNKQSSKLNNQITLNDDEDDNEEEDDEDEEDEEGDDDDELRESFETVTTEEADHACFDDDSEQESSHGSEPTLAPEKQQLLAKVLTREQLIKLLSILRVSFDVLQEQDEVADTGQYPIRACASHKGRVCVAMVGHPNVGKSSVINTILGVSKTSHGQLRVAVSSTPGKTKHFQTLIVNDSLMLCDCPGLVFPSFMNSTGEMVCSGILPINQMRDHVEPGSIIASRLPMPLLEATYGIQIKRVLDFKDNPDRPPTASEFLGAYCAVKGYIAGGTGRWDEFRACKDVLRDFNDGRLLHVCYPNGIEVDEERWAADTEYIMCRNERVAERLALQKLKELQLNPKDAVTPADEAIEVFGDGTFKYDDESDDEVCSERESSTITGMNGQAREKRDHKRLKHWGKKNKKLRDKTPYSEDNGAISYVAYSTNRGLSTLKTDKVHRQGTPFVRSVLPHHHALGVTNAPNP